MFLRNFINRSVCPLPVEVFYQNIEDDTRKNTENPYHGQQHGDESCSGCKSVGGIVRLSNPYTGAEGNGNEQASDDAEKQQGTNFRDKHENSPEVA